ncbi:ABC transporter ATP-binding protein [Rhodococcus pseudokoreensis]|uniref:ABC transporter ATP-binding protein n=1 Tax=Rhodococcus pseudokoreensis TaxID=2811421 RepID=A0A974W4N9_9NOCA|nr:ABC transporter ATP-binding protein [Rhodococcus pseudokoreensis]
MAKLKGSPPAGSTQPDRREISPGDVLKAEGLSYRYPTGLQAVGNFTTGIKPGEIVSIVGPSGCGKSTLLRILAGLREPTGGVLERREPEAGRHTCSMVFQEDTLLPWLKVAENVRLFYRFQGERASKRRDRIMELLSMVGLEKFADSYPSQLSGGMRRRVAVLTAVAPLPSLLLLDEPFSALDEPSRIAVHQDVYQLIRTFNITAVLVTHDLGEAVSLSDRILLLSSSPSTIVKEFHTPFGAERDLLEVRSDPRFLEMYGDIWNDFRRQSTKAGV